MTLGSGRERFYPGTALLQNPPDGPVPLQPQAAERGLFPELCRPPSDRGGYAFGRDHFAKFLTELGPGRVERADDVEPGVKGGAEAGGIGATIDRTLCRVGQS
jgi:hypothetical protein